MEKKENDLQCPLSHFKGALFPNCKQVYITMLAKNEFLFFKKAKYNFPYKHNIKHKNLKMFKA